MGGTGSGYGKVILFNEHFVVYGIPAIASAIHLSTTLGRISVHHQVELARQIVERDDLFR